jgi:hypothetical protein
LTPSQNRRNLFRQETNNQHPPHNPQEFTMPKFLKRAMPVLIALNLASAMLGYFLGNVGMASINLATACFLICVE